MKRMMILTIAMVTVLVSLGGCYIAPWHGRGGGHGHHWNGGYDYDRGRGGHDRHWNRGYYYDGSRGGYDHYRNGRFDHHRDWRYDWKR